MLHIPVLLEQSIEFLIHDIDGVYLDCTFGRGGHSQAILNKLSKFGSLTSIDKDLDAYNYGKNLIDDERHSIHHKSFSEIDDIFTKESVSGILFDLGTCSTHFDDATRGFSFNKDAELDMRFDQSKGIKLRDWINNAEEEIISEILFKYGNEKKSRKIANQIIQSRSKAEIKTTLELASIIQSVFPDKKFKINPATKSFQAFRIFINDELKELQDGLIKASKILNKGGLIVIISFHSLEDRLVKNFFKDEIVSYPKDIPVNNNVTKTFNCIAKKIKPSQEEIAKNPRSRSAVMRVFQKL